MSVAVAVTARPGLIATGRVAVNETLPVASVVTVVVPRKVCPWAWLPGPGRGLSKNSRVNVWPGVLSSVPAIVLPATEVSTG